MAEAKKRKKSAKNQTLIGHGSRDEIGIEIGMDRGLTGGGGRPTYAWWRFSWKREKKTVEVLDGESDCIN